MSTKQVVPQTPAASRGAASRRVRALAVTAMLSAAARLPEYDRRRARLPL